MGRKQYCPSCARASQKGLCVLPQQFLRRCVSFPGKIIKPESNFTNQVQHNTTYFSGLTRNYAIIHIEQFNDSNYQLRRSIYNFRYVSVHTSQNKPCLLSVNKFYKILEDWIFVEELLRWITAALCLLSTRRPAARQSWKTGSQPCTRRVLLPSPVSITERTQFGCYAPRSKSWSRKSTWTRRWRRWERCSYRLLLTPRKGKQSWTK